MNIRRELRGVCYVDCDAKTALRLMNICGYKGIVTWRNKKKKTDGFYIYSSDRSVIEGVAEKYSLEVKMNEVNSLRRIFTLYKKRLSFLAGFVIFGILIYIESLYVWRVDVEGCSDLTPEEVISVMESEYPCYGKKKNDIDLDALKDVVADNFEEVCWISCSISGTHLTVRLRESVDVFTRTEPTDPCNVVAAMDCTIYSIVTSAGTPVVIQGDEVKKGDILISGAVNILNDDSEVVETKMVPADGEVLGVCDIPYSDSVDMNQCIKVPTGNEIGGVKIKLGRKVISPYSKKPAGTDSDVSQEEHSLHFGDFYLPVSVTIERYKYYDLKNELLDENAVKLRLQEHIQTYIGKMQEKGVQIVRKNVIITNGNAGMKADGNITVILPVGIPD